jgi:hypothetical protein
MILSVLSAMWRLRPTPRYALAIAELVDCRRMTKSDESAACCACYPGAYSWVMDNIQPEAENPGHTRAEGEGRDMGLPSSCC